jgi:hypothetical protein
MTPSPRSAAGDVRRFLEQRLPCSYCDACLALNLQISLEEAKTIALTVADSPGFIRQHHKCDACGRAIEVTSVGRHVRQRS